MKVKEILHKKNLFQWQYADIEGFVIVGTHLTYLVDNCEKEILDIIQPAILIPELKIKESLKQKLSMKIGSTVLFEGYAKFVGAMIVSAYSMFPMVMINVAEFNFQIEPGNMLNFKYFDIPKTIFIQGLTSLSAKQAQTIKSIIGGTENFLQVRARLTNGEKHLLIANLSPEKCSVIVGNLLEVGITQIITEYADAYPLKISHP